MTIYPKRLIEVDLPIARISAHARREKSIRHGHISTLHIWWARRPLAACRAVICAALWPDPVDDLCPRQFKIAAMLCLKAFAKRAFPDRVNEEGKQIKDAASPESLARWEALAAGTLTLDPDQSADGPILRMCLLDFIADFANWDNSTVPAYLETARRLTGVAHASLSDPSFALPEWAESSRPIASMLVGAASTSVPSPQSSGLNTASSVPAPPSSGERARVRGNSARSNGETYVTTDVAADSAHLLAWLSTLDSQLSTLPRPLVVDPFCGGGSIPLEALRVGADAFASDLNPVPVLLNKVVLEYIPKYGRRLAEEVRKWGAWIKQEAEQELAEFYPKDPDGATPIAYLWARTIRCEGPACGAEVPLIRSLWLAKKANRSVALRLIPNPQEKRVDFDILVKQRDGWVSQAGLQARPVSGKALAAGDRAGAYAAAPAASALPLIKNPSFDGTVKRGSATCPCCGYTTPVARVREQLTVRHGGAHDARMLGVVTSRPNEVGRFYRCPTERDIEATRKATLALEQRQLVYSDGLSAVPDEVLPLMSGVFNVPIYGHNSWGTLFTPRQSLALTTFVRVLATVTVEGDSGLAQAVKTSLALVVDRIADKLTSLCRWDNSRENAQGTFGRQALGMIWDFNEVNPFSGSGGDWATALEWVALIIDQEQKAQKGVGHVEQASATAHPLPDDSASAIVTDPPYYNAVPYADLSDFFFVWLKRTLRTEHPTLFSSDLSPKDAEACHMSGWDSVRYPHKDSAWYERQMGMAMSEARRVLSPTGVGIVVFAHKSTSGWEAQLRAMIDAGWVITGSWPIDTEMGNRLRAMGSAALASSVHLVCRPREDASGAVTESVGEWRDVLGELPRRIHEWMPRLAAEGVVGADAIFACLGPALEIFSRYRRVEKANGETATLREYLEFVWAAVSTEALALIFQDADAAGLEPDARLTAMWLWTLGGGKSEGGNVKGEAADEEDAGEDDDDAPAKSGKLTGGFMLEYDAARKIAQGLGVHLEQCQSLVEVKGDKARLLPVAERTQYLFGKDTQAASSGGGRKQKVKQQSLFAELREAEAAESGWSDLKGPAPGNTVLDRVHQTMILFAANRGELLKRFLVDDGIGKDARFWKLADNLNKLYPSGTEERRWIEGVLARKKGLGL